MAHTLFSVVNSTQQLEIDHINNSQKKIHTLIYEYEYFREDDGERERDQQGNFLKLLNE